MIRFAKVVFNIPVNKFFTYSLPDVLPWETEMECVDGRIKVEEGFRVIATLGKRKLPGFVVGLSGKRPKGDYEIKPVERIVDIKPLFGDKLLGLAEWMSKTYMCSLGEALSTILPGARREKDDRELLNDYEVQDSRVILADQQVNAINTILNKKEGTYYLQGVTGSGKTEVYLRVAEKVLEEGKGVIYLVPEISLVNQVVTTIAGTLGSEVAVLHSGMTPSQRLREWSRIREREANMVVGARSAVFAPMENLGLIIIDEEHETSYKAGATPRYHARQVAAHRCQSEDAFLIMGSATPSVDAYQRMEEGSLTRLILSERISGGAMPDVEIVDMRKEKGPLSKKLIQAIKDTHREGRQTILFLNRRGFAYYFYCRSCGYEMKCVRCSVSLTFHKDRNQMICHYCGYRTQPAEVCPQCGSLDIGYSGFGTERIEEEIHGILPGLSVKRVDTDAVRKKRELGKALSDFRKGEIDILLGTQMVAKGLNFPGVKLVGIVSADVGLQLPDFRALERTFSLIVQVSGRAGRMTPDGKVMIQTLKPENSVLLKAARMQLEDFYREELAMREKLLFPPYFRIIRLVFRGRDRQNVLEAAEEFSKLLKSKPSLPYYNKGEKIFSSPRGGSIQDEAI
jgi:primosomal protein N' (replication factor Y)